MIILVIIYKFNLNYYLKSSLLLKFIQNMIIFYKHLVHLKYLVVLMDMIGYY